MLQSLYEALKQGKASSKPPQEESGEMLGASVEWIEDSRTMDHKS
jgi:hypothetical protein